MSVTVRFGAAGGTFEVAGDSVGDVRENLGGALGLTGGEQARIDGSAAEDDHELSNGETLEFIKAAGEKG